MAFFARRHVAVETVTLKTITSGNVRDLNHHEAIFEIPFNGVITVIWMFLFEQNIQWFGVPLQHACVLSLTTILPESLLTKVSKDHCSCSNAVPTSELTARFSRNDGRLLNDGKLIRPIDS